MINEEKIRLMTRLTVYEEGGGIGDRRIAGYFPGDYVFAQLIGSFVTGTIAWGICAAIYCGYFFEQVFFSVYEDAAGPLLRMAILSYVAWILFYLLITFVVYRRRGVACERRRRLYEQDLDAMLAICEEERAAPGSVEK